MKKIFLLFIFIWLFAGCKQEKKDENKSSTIVTNNENEEAINKIKEFYSLFYTSSKPFYNEKLKKQYVSERIIKRIDSLNSDEENLILDYDPFINGQDYYGNIIKKTIEVKPINNKNEYRVSFLLFGEKNEKKTNIDLLLKKNQDGKFLIYSILSNEYLNFNNLSKKINSDTNPNKVNKDDYISLMKSNLSSPEKVTNHLIFTKDEKGELIVNTEILNYIQRSTSETNNAYTMALSNYVTNLIIEYYEKNTSIFTENDLFKIIAYSANTTDPLFKKFWKNNIEKWSNGNKGYILGFCNVAYHNQIWNKLTENFKQNKYYNLPYLEVMVWFGSDFDKTGAP